MTTTTIDGAVRRPPPGAAASRKTPIWGLPMVRPDVAEQDESLPGEALPYARPWSHVPAAETNGAHAARRLQLVGAAVEAGEATRGRPPPVSTGLVLAAQVTFLAAAVLNVVMW